MLEGRRLKDRKSPGQFEARGNIDNRNKQQQPQHRNEGSTRNLSSIVGLSKINTTRIPKKIDTPTSAPPVVSSSHHQQPLSVPLSSTSLSVSSPCTTTTATPTATSGLTPEIYFLIREHAKTLEAISKITNRVDKLEHKIDDICRKVKQIDRYNHELRGGGCGGNGMKKGESSSSSGITPNALSDDSGVEYSRTTNGTGHDDDELLSLLNQITKFSDSIKQTLTQPNCNLHSPTIPRPDHYLHQQHHPPPPPPPSTPPHPPTHTHPLHHPHHPHHPHHHLIAPTETGSMVFGLTGSTSSTASSTLKQSVHSNINGGIRHHQSQPLLPPGPLPPPPSGTRKTLSSSMDHSRLTDCPDPTSAPQSFSALLFESNVEHFLANLDFVPEPVRTSDYYYPPSMPISPPSPPNHLLHHHHHQQHQHSHQHHQTVKSHPIPASRLLTETLHHPHEQPDQQ